MFHYSIIISTIIIWKALLFETTSSFEIFHFTKFYTRSTDPDQRGRVFTQNVRSQTPERAEYVWISATGVCPIFENPNWKDTNVSKYLGKNVGVLGKKLVEYSNKVARVNYDLGKVTYLSGEFTQKAVKESVYLVALYHGVPKMQERGKRMIVTSLAKGCNLRKGVQMNTGFVSYKYELRYQDSTGYDYSHYLTVSICKTNLDSMNEKFINECNQKKLCRLLSSQELIMKREFSSLEEWLNLLKNSGIGFEVDENSCFNEVFHYEYQSVEYKIINMPRYLGYESCNRMRDCPME